MKKFSIILAALMFAAIAIPAQAGPGGVGVGFAMQRIEAQEKKQRDMSAPNDITHRPFGKNCEPEKVVTNAAATADEKLPKADKQ